MNKRLETILEVHLRHRRNSGQAAHRVERALRKMIGDMQANGEEFISYKNTMRWLQTSFPDHSHTTKMERYSYIQMLSEWANAFDSRHQVLPKKSKPVNKRTPNILTSHEVSRLMDELANHHTRGGFNGYTSSIMTGLMFVTGMRIGETFTLKRENFDRENATIYVPDGKSECDRFIPLHSSTIETLLEYSKKRDARFPGIHDHFFLFDRGVAKTRKPFTDLFRKISSREDMVNYLDSDVRENSLRPHDMRHSFAVNSLIQCYEDGRNIEEEVAKLSILLAHKTLKETYWYITGIPRLMEIAMKVGAKS